MTTIPTTFTHMPMPKRVVSWIRSRIGILKKEIEELQNEQEMWKLHLDTLNVCQNCNGYGELREIIAQDESIFHKCEKCGGAGVIKP